MPPKSPLPHGTPSPVRSIVWQTSMISIMCYLSKKKIKVHLRGLNALLEKCEMRSCPVHLGTTLLVPEGSTNRLVAGVGEDEHVEPYEPTTSFYFSEKEGHEQFFQSIQIRNTTFPRFKPKLVVRGGRCRRTLR